MLQTVLDADPVGDATSFRDTHLTAYRFMLLARMLDDKCAGLYRAGKIHGGVFIGRGQEALSVAIGLSLKKSDVFAPLIRDTAGRLAFGEPVVDALRTYLGSVLGPMRGRDGNVHRGRPKKGYLPMVSHLGAMVSVVNGTLFARRMKGVTGMVGATCIGDGATSTGAVSRSDQPGRGRKTAARFDRGGQPIRILNAHFAPICLPRPGRPGRRLRRGIPFRGRHGFVRVPEGGG